MCASVPKNDLELSHNDFAATVRVRLTAASKRRRRTRGWRGWIILVSNIPKAWDLSWYP